MSVAKRHRVPSLAITRKCLAAAIASLVIAHAQADGSDPQNAKVLQQVSVTATSALDRYRAIEADTGAVGQRNLLDTPFSISPVTSELLQNRQAIDINEAFAADPGVTPVASGYAGESSGFAVRGLAVDLLNGYKMDGLSIPNWGSDVPQEPFSQIELLKGPGGFMYGFGQPGGILNFVSKQPTARPMRALRWATFRAVCSSRRSIWAARLAAREDGAIASISPMKTATPSCTTDTSSARPLRLR